MNEFDEIYNRGKAEFNLKKKKKYKKAIFLVKDTQETKRKMKCKSKIKNIN